MTTTDNQQTTGEAAVSPFELPAMSDAYPLDRVERQTIDDLLDKFAQERAERSQASDLDRPTGRVRRSLEP
jgi:hypothetical protein